MKFILEASDDSLTTQSGLGVIGLLLSKTKLSQRFNAVHIPAIKTTHMEHVSSSIVN